MKTAISMPDETFHRVTQTASRLGMSRSELMTKAADAYLDELDGQSLTDEINRVLDRLGDDAATDQALVEVSKARLAEIDDEW